MADLIVGFDVGASSTKIIYGLRVGEKPSLLRMPPEVIEATHHTLETYKALNGIGIPQPEAEAWVEMGDRCVVVGSLAREFLADAGMHELKYERAVYKVMAALGVIKQRLNLPAKFSVALGVLLPYDEYPDRERFSARLKQLLKDYKFRGERLRVKLEHFECVPEGFGLAASRLKTKGSMWFKERSLSVCMFGHRNTSALVFTEGKLNSRLSTTSDLGFHQLIEKVRRLTSGQKSEVLTEAVFKAGSDITATNRAIASLARSHDEQFRTQETEEIVAAIATAREEYWERLKAWINVTVSTSMNEVILCGGGAMYFKNELEAYFKRTSTPTYWGHEIESLIVDVIFNSRSGTEPLAFRLIDVWGIFNKLKSSKEQVAA